MPRLTDDELEAVPGQIPGWSVAEGALERRLTFAIFGNAVAFINRVADVAEDVGHYPRLALDETGLTLRLVTPGEGITERDVYLARRINALLGR
jgi:4a-hydroxytetrahydrobiopterin dehydratase